MVTFNTAYLIPLLFAGIGACIVIFSIINLIKAFASSSWLTSEGRIIDSKIIEFSSSDNGQASICYSYTVNDRGYSSSRISFGNLFQTGSYDCNEIAEKYQKDLIVTVYYNPLHPKESVLEPGINSKCCFNLGLGIFMLLTSYFVFRVVI